MDRSTRRDRAGSHSASLGIDSIHSGDLVNSLALVWTFLVLLVSALNAPGVTQPYPAVSVLLSAGCCFWAAVLCLRVQVTPRNTTAMIAPAFLLLWACLTSVGSYDTFRTQQSLAAWVGGIGVFYCLALGCSSGSRWRLFCLAMTAAATGLCLYGFVRPGAHGRLLATFSNRDSFSVLPMLSVFLALAQLNKKTRVWRGLFWPQLGILIAAVLRSESRAACLGMLCGLLVLPFLLRLAQSNKRLRTPFINARLAGVLVLLAGALVAGLARGTSSRFAELMNGKDDQGITMRVDVLSYGATAVTNHPFVGSGPGTFALAYQQVRPHSIVPEYIYVNVAHNDFVELPVEMGLPALFLWGALLVAVVNRGLRIIRSETATWEPAALAAGIVALLVFSALNFVMAVPCLLFWSCAQLGLLQGMPAARQKRAEHISHQQKFVFFTLVGLGAWAAWFGAHSVPGTLSFRAGEKAISQLRWEKAVEEFTNSIHWQPQNARAHARLGLAKARLAQFHPNAEQLRSAAADLEEAARLSPRDPEITKSRVQFFESVREFERAEKVLVQARKFSPYRDELLQELARVRLFQHKLAAGAQSLYEAALSDPSQKKMLETILIDLETQTPGASLPLFEDWTARQGKTGVASVLAERIAERLLEKGNVDSARKLVFFLAERENDDPGTRYLLARIAGAEGKRAEQKHELEKLVLDADHYNHDPYVDLALIDWAELQPKPTSQGVVNRLEKRLRSNSSSIPLRLELSRLYLQSGKTEDAAELISSGLQSAPDEPALLARMGTCLQAQGLRDMANEYYNQALTRDPKNAEAKAKALPQ